MRKRFIIVLFVVFILLLPGCYFATDLPSKHPDPSNPNSDFGFIFIQERESKIQCMFNTFKNKLKSGIFPVDLNLSPSDLNMIRNQMEVIEFFNYPNKYTFRSVGGSVSWGNPYTYQLKAIDKNNRKMLTWTDDTIKGDLKTDNLRLLINMIKDIIDSKESKKDYSDFDFVFQYGFHGDIQDSGNVLNTFKETYLKDMVKGPKAKTKLVVTEEEKKMIFQKMKDINFFDCPVCIEPEEGVYISPPTGYYFRVKYGSNYKELFRVEEFKHDAQADNLNELIELITNIIESKKEYKDLPEPKSGYW